MGICNIYECHLVARAERLAEVWPTDEAFRRFASEVADAVQAAVGRGDRIVAVTNRDRDSESCMCPIGAVFAVKGDPEGGSAAPRRFPILGLSRERAAFVEGFEGYVIGAGISSTYYRLGQAYRRRFVTGAGDQS